MEHHVEKRAGDQRLQRRQPAKWQQSQQPLGSKETDRGGQRNYREKRQRFAAPDADGGTSSPASNVDMRLAKVR